MRLIISILLTSFFAFANINSIEDIKKEYASMLFQNPRGIGCHKCHGINGEGKVLARYISKKGPQTLVAPNIQGLEYRVFYNALNASKEVMPRYYLTDKEIESLYFYLKSTSKDTLKK